MAKEQAKEKKVKRPTALKRVIQDEKRRIRNRTFKSRVRTVIRKFDEVKASGDAEKIKTTLSEVYSIMDKGVKHGIIKKNKANRTKARLTVGCCAA